VLRRLKSPKLIRSLRLRAKDLRKTVRFALNPEPRRQWKRELADARSPGDVLSVAKAAFGSNQKKPEILGLLGRLNAEEPRFVCEIGVAEGGTNFLLTHALRKVELMLGVDLFVKGRQRLRYFARPDQRLLYFDGDSHGPRMIKRLGAALAGRKIDFLFIDGDHSYAGARDDFLGYRQFVREGGTIAFHDICQDFMTRYGRDTGNISGEVPALWEKLKKIYPSEEFVEAEGQDGYGIGAISYSHQIGIPSEL